MNTRRTAVRLGLVVLLVISVFGVSNSIAGVVAPGADGGATDHQVDAGPQPYQDTIDLPPPEPIEPTFHTAPCDATCVD